MDEPAELAAGLQVTRPGPRPRRWWIPEHGSTLGRLLLNNVWAALAALTLYTIFRVGELLADRIDELLRISDPSSAEFFRLVLSWGAAFSGSALWLIFTFYQLVGLRGELLNRGRHDAPDG